MISSLVARLLTGSFGAMVSGFSWFQLVPGFGHGNEVGTALGLHDPHEGYFIATAWAMVALLLGLAVLGRMGLEKAMALPDARKYIPDAGFSVRNIWEVILQWLLGLAESMLGKHEAKAFFPLIATLFVYVLINNASGFVPGMLPLTENISSNLALALCVFVVFNYAGLSRNGMGYIKHLAGPVVALAPAFLVLETVSLLIRPVSLSVRLTVNIFVDHLLQTIARDLGGTFLSAIGSALLPVPLYFLGLLVCVVQAFVFALLTTIYISLSVAHTEEHSHAH